jgi:hypothetical protein
VRKSKVRHPSLAAIKAIGDHLVAVQRLANDAELEVDIKVRGAVGRRVVTVVLRGRR